MDSFSGYLEYEFVLLHPEIFVRHKRLFKEQIFVHHILKSECAWAPELAEYFVYVIEYVHTNLVLHPETVKQVLRYPDLQWPWDKLSLNPALTPDVIEKLPDRVLEKLDWLAISKKSGLSPSFVEMYKERINLCAMFVKAKEEEPRSRGWDDKTVHDSLPKGDQIFIISKSTNILDPARVTWDYVFSHPEISWDFEHLFSRLPINMEAISKFRSMKPFRYLSSNKDLTIKFIDEHKDENWDLTLILRNKSIDIDYAIDFAQEKKYKRIDIIVIGRDDFTWLTLVKHMNVEWGWEFVASGLRNTRVLWAPNIHKYFPEWDKRVVWTVLLIMRRVEMPHDIILTILRMII